MDNTNAPSSVPSKILENTDIPNLHKEVLDNIYDGVYYVDRSKKIILWNKSAEKITGFKKEEVTGFRCSSNILRHINDNGDELCIKGCPLSRTMADGKIRDANVYLHHKNGHRVPISVRVSPVFNKDQKIIGVVEIFSDNSKNINLIKELEILRSETYTDILTQVGNRRFIEFDLNQRFEDLETHDIEFGILLFDIDKFKHINDTFGHDIGDAVLKMVSKTIFNIIRSLDSICRWGGDEFIVILPNVDKEMLSIIAEKIRLFVEKTWLQTSGTILRTTLSIGATMAKKTDTIDSLIKRADNGMYQSKQKGRNTVSIV
ncbi:MAG: diguanylate cyclase [Pseudomonadota bacterium]